MTTSLGEQLTEAYKRMAREARYRPAAPSDGFGNITVPEDELDLEAEARDYAVSWWAEEDQQYFWLGCCDFVSRPAAVFAVEAARNLNAGTIGKQTAIALLKMALRDVERDARQDPHEEDS